MPTLNDLADCLVASGGLEGPRVRTVKRYLFESGVLPKTARGDAPQVEAIHAVVHLLACVAHEHQTHAVDALLSIWRLKEAFTSPRREDAAGTLWHGPATPSADASRHFGRTLHEILSATAAWAGPGPPPELCQRLFVWRGYPHAQIQFQDRLQEYQLHFSGEGLRHKHLPPPADRIHVIAAIPWSTLLALSELVAESRQLAIKQGVAIEEETTWRALEPPQPADPQTGFPHSERADTTTPDSGTTEAAKAPPSAASETGQPATKALAAPNSAELTLSRERDNVVG